MEIHIIIEHAELDLGGIATIITGIIFPLAKYLVKMLKRNQNNKIPRKRQIKRLLR